MAITTFFWSVPEETIDDLYDEEIPVNEIIEELHEINEELPQDEKIGLDIDKALPGLLYIFSQYSSRSEEEIVSKYGKKVPRLNQGYDPAHAFSNKETRKLGDLFKKHPFQELVRKVNYTQFSAKKVYPFTENEPKESVYKYLQQNYEKVGNFIADAGKKGYGLIVYDC
jgi:hypothetical protein